MQKPCHTRQKGNFWEYKPGNRKKRQKMDKIA
jgi:hypothetical protein